MAEFDVQCQSFLLFSHRAVWNSRPVLISFGLAARKEWAEISCFYFDTNDNIMIL